VTAIRHAAHVNSIARFQKYPKDQERKRPFARRARPSRGHRRRSQKCRRARQTQNATRMIPKDIWAIWRLPPISA